MATHVEYRSAVQWQEFDGEACSVAQAVQVLGDRWTVLVLRDIFNGVRRFDDLQRHLGIARDVLTKRLAALVEEGVVVRQPYREPGARTRHQYTLTPAGWELRPVLLALIGWGDRHRPQPGGAPVVVEHDACGEPVQVALVCAGGHPIGSDTRLRMRPGPGARRLA
jgi:DNA-binding HxlR family transcriptional regulator